MVWLGRHPLEQGCRMSIMATGAPLLTRALEGTHPETPVEEAESVLVGDLD
jgi:hypothetical protein